MADNQLEEEEKKRGREKRMKTGVQEHKKILKMQYQNKLRILTNGKAFIYLHQTAAITK